MRLEYIMQDGDDTIRGAMNASSHYEAARILLQDKPILINGATCDIGHGWAHEYMGGLNRYVSLWEID